ncbi:MAG TPA: DUF4097 family beta strand repeat-containing protein [Mucilaginibacter sp.]|nr:DUF4097 family beta strand repeat-containing protein [Mucilaginibacter sp.]
MKTILTLLLACGISTLALAQDDRTPYSTQSLANDAISSVRVLTSAGGILVSGEAGQQPRIDVYIRGNNNRDLSKDEIKRRLDENFDMSITVNNRELQAIVKNKHDHIDWNEDGLSISFKIYVPQDVATDLKTSGGGIHLDHLKGNEQFSTSGGGLEINTVNGTIHGTTSGGGIDVKNSGDNINLVTSGGGIRAENCSGDISLRTSGGGLELNDLKGTIHATTSGGGIRGENVEGELITSTSGGGIDLRNMNCSLDAHSSAGSVSVQVKQVGKYLKLDTSAGNIDLELPLKQGLSLNITADRINQHPFNISDFTGDWDKNHIKGTVNGGGAQVDANANSGHIDVRFN